MTELEIEATKTAELEQLREELAQRNERVALLEAELASYRAGKTWPPPTSIPPSAGDYSTCKQIAQLTEEVSTLRSEFITLSKEVAALTRSVSEYTPIMDRVVAALQDPRCADCPNRPRLHSVSPAGE